MDKPQKKTYLDQLLEQESHDVRLEVAAIVQQYDLDPNDPYIRLALLVGRAEAACKRCADAIQARFDINIGRCDAVHEQHVQILNASARENEAAIQVGLLEYVKETSAQIAGKVEWRKLIYAGAVGIIAGFMVFWIGYKMGGQYVDKNLAITVPELKALRQMTTAEINYAVEFARNNNLECFVDPESCKIKTERDKNGRKYASINVWLESKK